MRTGRGLWETGEGWANWGMWTAKWGRGGGTRQRGWSTDPRELRKCSCVALAPLPRTRLAFKSRWRLCAATAGTPVSTLRRGEERPTWLLTWTHDVPLS